MGGNTHINHSSERLNMYKQLLSRKNIHKNLEILDDTINELGQMDI